MARFVLRVGNSRKKDARRQAKVIAILKPGKDPNLVASYRPISLLPVCFKLLECLILHQTSPVLEKTITDEQAGFRQGRRTGDQVLALMNEWMNEWCIFIVYCCTPKALYNHVGGVSPQPPPVCSINLDDATAATGQRRQYAHHTPATGGEEREIEPIKWMGIIRRPCLARASGGNLARTPGLHPYSLREVPWDFFYDHRESGPQFNVSSEGRCFLIV